jgi:hypothetical protein
MFILGRCTQMGSSRFDVPCNAFLNQSPLIKILWKMEIPLKIKNFLWYLGKWATLTKDNLWKYKWKGSLQCSFCNQIETIKHLFFECYIARATWHMFSIATGLSKPNSIWSVLGGWLSFKRGKEKRLILVGVTTMFWSIWLCCNDIVFNKKLIISLVQVVFQGTHWYRSSRLLQKESYKQEVVKVCHTLEVVAMEVLAKNGWSSYSRISAS